MVHVYEIDALKYCRRVYNLSMKKVMLWLVVLMIGATGTAAMYDQRTAHAARVDEFIITDYHVDMSLGRDSENHSTLETTETIEAVFSDEDKNHGLERQFVTQNDNHQTSFQLVSVTNEAGENLPYHWEDSFLRIGDKHTYVHGEQTYVIKYTQNDVTLPNAYEDVFYWDVLGVNWRVPIDSFTALVTVRPELAPHLIPDKTQCYRGLYNEAHKCVAAPQFDSATHDPSQPKSYLITSTNEGKGSGVTVKFGFKTGTFAAYSPTLRERLVRIWWRVQFVLLFPCLAIAIWMTSQTYRLEKRTRGIGPVSMQYLPPPDTSLTMAAVVRYQSAERTVMTAQILDLAIRNYIRIYEVASQKNKQKTTYEIEIAQDPAGLMWEEQQTLKQVFYPKSLAVGLRINLEQMEQANVSLIPVELTYSDVASRAVSPEGYLVEDRKTGHWRHTLSRYLPALALLTLSPVVGALWVYTKMHTIGEVTRLTDKGKQLVSHLEGLKLYIDAAVKDQSIPFQTPEDVHKTVMIGPDGHQQNALQLQETLLPYAVLFGQGDQWNKKLAAMYNYAHVQPPWYGYTYTPLYETSYAHFFINSFSDSMTSFSSSPDLSGSGFSGGGGGGGGGGGW